MYCELAAGKEYAIFRQTAETLRTGHNDTAILELYVFIGLNLR